MPCYITGSADGDARLVTDELRKEADRLNKMLCALMELLEFRSDWSNRLETAVYPNVPGLKKWWTNHKKIDEERREEEKSSADKKCRAILFQTIENLKSIGYPSITDKHVKELTELLKGFEK